MKSHVMNLNNNLPHQRRTLLKAGAATALGTLGWAQAQQGPTLEVLLANALVGGPLKGILESEGKFKINDNPFQSSTDVVARLVAPGGTTVEMDAARALVRGDSTASGETRLHARAIWAY